MGATLPLVSILCSVSSVLHNRGSDAFCAGPRQSEPGSRSGRVSPIGRTRASTQASPLPSICSRSRAALTTFTFGLLSGCLRCRYLLCLISPSSLPSNVPSNCVCWDSVPPSFLPYVVLHSPLFPVVHRARCLPSGIEGLWCAVSEA